MVRWFANGVLDLDAAGLHTAEEITTYGFRAYWADTSRVIASNTDFRDYWTGISSTGDFLTTVQSYTAIRESLGRLCHRLIVFTIARRGQTPEKVTTTGHWMRGRVITKESLQGLNVVVRDLMMIDMDELVAAAGAGQADQEIPEEGVQADPTPAHAPQAPPDAPAPRTIL
ncbi:hypothetical protein Tco_0706718 [Tanacetum coccineum]|uniref:Uncharacterized protein n=1 Tax=Tanacetum coccineum TaxID=301880 RepID=A0ABQ4Y955_9ASTR